MSNSDSNAERNTMPAINLSFFTQLVAFWSFSHFGVSANQRPESRSRDNSPPIRDQYPGHVITISQSEAKRILIFCRRQMLSMMFSLSNSHNLTILGRFLNFLSLWILFIILPPWMYLHSFFVPSISWYWYSPFILASCSLEIKQIMEFYWMYSDNSESCSHRPLVRGKYP